MKFPFVSPGAPLLVFSLLLSGCTLLTAEQKQQLETLDSQVQGLQTQLQATQSHVDDVKVQQSEKTEAMQASLQKIDARLVRLPKRLQNLCPTITANTPANCPEPTTQVVIKDSDKMIVGELERVWLDPPGVQIVARIDTGANSSSVHAGKLVEFERDGDEWVRFEWQLKDESITVERPIERYVRVVQQADPKGTRRPVVNMRVRMGDVEDSFDFTLANRSHLDYQIILGRNFLTDVALVDVGQQFVQPSYKPES